MKPNETYLSRHRSALLRHATPAENYLWNLLRHAKLCDRRFRRQISIGNYIVDFYCKEEKLVIELDVEIHGRQGEEGDLRAETLKGMGYKVLRFENRFVFEDTIGVLQEIARCFRKREPPPSAPLEYRGGVLPLERGGSDVV